MTLRQSFTKNFQIDICPSKTDNLTAMSSSPSELLDAIRERDNGFDISYKPDQCEQIASSWPDSIDDSDARRDWGWKPSYDLPAMVRKMLGV